MQNLILHVGMGKTGTTTIQEGMLSNYPNYLGYANNRKDTGGNLLCQELYQLISLFSRGQWADRSCSDWAEKARAFTQHHAPGSSAVLMSNEHLTSGSLNLLPFFPYLEQTRPLKQLKDSLPLVGFLKKFKTRCWPYGKIKVLLTLRNQSDWLASKYAQHSNRLPQASQGDFEERIKKLADPTFQTVTDFPMWIEGLHAGLGRENVEVLLLEEIESPCFWKTFCKLMELKNPMQDDLLEPRPIFNMRKKSADVWTLQPFHLREYLLHRLKQKGLISRSLRRSEGVRLLAGAFCMPYNGLARLTLKHKKGMEITLTDELRTTIRKICQEKNQRLAKLLERDLPSYGY